MHITPMIFALLLLVSPVLARAETGFADATVRRLFHDTDEAMLARNPLNAILRGDMRYAGEIGDTYSDAHYAAEKKADEDALTSLAAIDRFALTPVNQIAYDAFKLNTEIDLEQYRPELMRVWVVMPINHFAGLPLTYADLSSGQGAAPFKTAEDYRAAIHRNAAFGGQIDQIIKRFRQGIAQGVTEPKLVARNMITQLDAQAVNGVDGSPYAAVLAKLPAMPAADARALAAAYRASVATDLLPPLIRLRDFLRDEYLPSATETVGLGALPGGAAYYRYLIRARTTVALAPDVIHALGLSEVARVTSELDEIRRLTGFQGDLHGFLTFMTTSPRFAPASRQAIEASYKRLQATILSHIAEQFSLVPKTPLEILPTPAYREQTSAEGEYSQGSADGTRPGIFYFDGYDLPSRFTWAQDGLFLHEAIPGHHFQISIAQENSALPAFMRFGGNDAYVEGWAFYAETLWQPLGVEITPYQRFGGLSDGEMLRDMRLVVDTGIHAMGWTRDEAIAYMLDHSAMGRADVTAEVERYIAIPGQALAYKIGQNTILKVKAKAQAAMGERFDPRAFHAKVLDTGALPLPVLEAKLDRWIAAQAKEQR